MGIEGGVPGDSGLRNCDHDSALHLLALGLAGVVETANPTDSLPICPESFPRGSPCSSCLRLLAPKDLTREQGP